MNTSQSKRVATSLNAILAGIVYLNRKRPEIMGETMRTSAGTFGTLGETATGMANAAVWFIGFNGSLDTSGNLRNATAVLNAGADFWCALSRSIGENYGEESMERGGRYEVLAAVKNAYLAIVQVVMFGADIGVNGPMLRAEIELVEAIRQANRAEKASKATAKP